MNQADNQPGQRKITAGSFAGFLLRSIVAGLALAFVILYLWPSISDRFASKPEVINTPVVTPVATVSYADAVDRAAPSVVSIYTRKR